MDRMLIQSGTQLNGTVATSGAKNAALPILFSTLLAEGEHTFTNVPMLKDIESTADLLASLGCTTQRDGHTFSVHVEKLKSVEASYELVRKMRASILCLGPILAKYGEAIVSLPGGCAIGTRPIDLHLDAMKALGATIELKEGYVLAKAKKLKGATILFEKTTVGGTENLMMAATLAKGTTVLTNAAREPEVVDLANFLILLGAQIEGAGTSTITIHGVKSLGGGSYKVIPDRIEAGTYLAAAAITSGKIKLKQTRPDTLTAVLEKFESAGALIDTDSDTVTLDMKGRRPRAVEIITAPYPGFPTDMQAQLLAINTIS